MYEAAPYTAKEWGVFHKPTKNWMVFGSKRAMQVRAAELNRLDRTQAELAQARIQHLDREISSGR